MHSKKVSDRAKKKSNIQLNTHSPFKENEISLTSVPSTEGMEGINVKPSENTLEVETLSETNLATSQRRSNRTRVNVDTTYHCKICHLEFSAEFSLRRHLDYYGDPKYACEVCATKFTDKKQLHTHVSSAHKTPYRQFTTKCVVCNQKFLQPGHLRAHMSHYHEDWNKSTKTIDDAEGHLTKVKSVINTESSDSISDDSNCTEGSNKSIKTQESKIEVHLDTQHNSENNTLLAESIENVTTYPATVFEKPLEDSDYKRDVISRREEQTVSTFLQSSDDLQNRPEDNSESQAITEVDGHPICQDREKSHELKDNENECTQILRKNEQMLCLNGETGLFLEPQVKDESDDTITKGDELIVVINMEKEILSQSVAEDGDESHERAKEDEMNIPPASDKPQHTLITHAEPGKSTDNGDASSVPRNTVPNVDEVLSGSIGIDVPKEEGVTLELSSISVPCVETENFHNIRGSLERPVNIVLLGARSDEDKIDEVHNCYTETELRRLHSCKDCYVPLVRMKISETSSGIVTTDRMQSESEKLHTVIPSVVCDQLFSTKEMMWRHYRLQHFSYFNDEVYCVCGKHMNGDETLKFHFYRYCQKTVLSATKPTDLGIACKPLEQKFACTGCKKKFWLASCLRSHVYNCNRFIRKKVKKILIKRRNILTNNRTYSCAVCRSPFRFAETLLRHEEMYSRIAKYRCFFCETKFFDKRWLNVHIAAAHTRTTYMGNFECTICSQRFSTQRLERMHRMHIHRDQLSLGDAREPTTNNLSPPDSDDPGDDDETSNKCNVCNTVFSNRKRYIDHTIYYMASETIHCKTCGEEFQGQYRAHHHNKTAHYSEDTRVAFTHHCSVCKEGFMYLTHLQAHMFHVHMSEAKNFPTDQDGADTVLKHDYACSVCDVRFSTPALLAEHETDFANDGEYLCNRCSKKCRTPSLLLDHLTLNHSNTAMQGGVKCRRCNENFLTQSAWISHVKHVHSPKEPSEFYLEKNVASTEKFGDFRYELIPTNESISDGLTYFKVKNSIHIPTIAATTDTNEGEDKRSFVAHTRRINTVIPAEETLVANSLEETEKTGFYGDKWRMKVENLEEEVLMLNNSGIISEDKSLLDTSTMTVAMPHAEGSTKAGDKQEETIDNSNERGNCNTCGYAFRDPADLARHLSLYSDGGPHMCEICGRRFEEHEFYQRHKFSHTDYEQSSFTCSTCNEGFDSDQGLKMHVAHFHSNMPPELPAGVSVEVPASKPQASQETLEELRETAPKQRWPEPNFYRPILPSSVKKSHQIATVLAQDDVSGSKIVETTGSPHLYTEIFEDEISMIYECPDCQEKYSSVKQLNEHLRTVHKINQGKNQPETCSKLLDTQVTCDVCDKVFANHNILITHRAKIHFIKPVRIVKSSTPVMEITVPNKRRNDPNNDQQSIVIGRLYKLEEINEDSKPVDDDDKSDIKKINSVSRIVGADVKQQKHLPKSIVKIKAKAAIQLKPPVANAVYPKSSAGTTVNIKTLPLIAIERKLPIANAVHLKSAAATVIPHKPPAATAKHFKLLLSTDEPFKSPVATAEPLTSPVATVVPPTSPVAPAAPLTSLAATTEQLEMTCPIDIRRKSPVANAFRLKQPAANFGVELKSAVGNVASLKPSDANYVKLNTSAITAKRLKPLSDRQMNLLKLNMGQVIFPQHQQQNNPNTEQQEIPKSEENMKLFRNRSSDSENGSTLKRVTLSNSMLVTSSPSTIMKPEILKIIKVESCSDLTSTASSNTANTTDTKFHYQFMCNICNIIFMNRRQLTEHEKTDHFLASLNDQVADESFTVPTSMNSSMNQLVQLVSSLPVQPKTENNTADQTSFTSDFESVLIPVSDDDFDDYVSHSPNNSELEGPVNEINPLLINPRSDGDNCKPVSLKVRSFSKIVKNLKSRNNYRKRKGHNPTEMLATKRPKEVFDPVTYKELCEQHNLTSIMKSHKSTTSSNIPQSKSVT